jgi:hypothetical protein
VIDDGLDRRAIAVDHREEPRQKSCLFDQLGDAARGERHLLGGLQDEGVPERERDGIHPHRHHRREVEGRDAGDDAERFTAVFAGHAARDLERAAAIQIRQADGELDHLEAALEPGERFGRRLPRLEGGERRDLLGVLGQ